MELKKYQQTVLDDLDLYINELEKQPTIKTAFRTYWANKGITIDSIENEYINPYNDQIKGVPNITIKVPTAGGKTYIACKALRHIFRTYPQEKPKVVVWFVPSEPILRQTYKNLCNPNHPYRRSLDVDFGSRVNIVNKESALVGDKIRPTQLKENLTIFVLSVQSFASNDKEGRKARRENENLADHVSSYIYKDKMLANADETSLLQVIAQLNPVMIIDESHNFERSELRIDLKKEINPCFIFNLTATPKENSNIISFVDAMQLKKENMVKLPVIVYNHKSTTDVIANAIALQHSLEIKAKKQQEEKNAKYIRPIVLFQAQPKIAEDNITFEKIKEKLIKSGIPEEQVKIKTADKDEIKNIDLMSESCEVRYIITVNALKEGWDCPFAYILASLANKSSKIDVEQILGRVLRLPYTQQQPSDLLNLSYVFTCSSDFQETLKRIVESLNNAGFSKRDFRVANNIQETQSIPMPQQEEPNLFNQYLFTQSNPTDSLRENEINTFNTLSEKDEDENLLDIQTDIIRQSIENNLDTCIETIVKHLNIQEISDKMLSTYIYDCIKNMDNEAIDDLITFQMQTIETIKNKINTILDKYRYQTFKSWLDIGKIRMDVNEEAYTLPKHIFLTQKMIGVQKGLYREEENVNGFEARIISAISNDDNVLFWHRNQERGKGFYINGFINHYPDFIVVLKSNRILLIETKGDDRDNSDSEQKLELGKTWANKAGDNYRYYMVFDKKAMNGAITIKELLNKIKQLSNI